MAAFKQVALDAPSQLEPQGAVVLPDSTEKRTQVAATATPPPSVTTPVLPNLDEAPSSIRQRSSQDVRPKRPFLLVGVGILVGMALLAALIFFVLRNRNVPTTDNVPTETAVVDQPDGSDTDFSDNSGQDSPLPNFDNFELPLVIRPIEVVRPLYQANPDNKSLALELAAAYMREEQQEEARAIVQELVQQTRLPIGIYALSNRLLEDKQFEMALIILEEGYGRFPADLEIQQSLMMTYLLNDISARRIEEYLTKLRTDDPHPTTLAIGEAYIVFDTGNPSQAITILESPEAIDDGRFASDLLFLKGILLLDLEKPEEALTVFEEALNHDPPVWLATLIEENIVKSES